MKKPELIEALRAKGAEFDENENYGRLLHLLKTLQKETPVIVTPFNPEPEPETSPEKFDGFDVKYPDSEEEVKKEPIKFVSKIVKRDHGHVSDSFRDDIDSDALRVEVRKLGYKPKIKTITRIKHMDLTAEGEYVTEFILDLKE